MTIKTPDIFPAAADSATAPSPPAPYRRGFWFVGYAFTVVMAFGAMPTPLYVLYAQRHHLSAVAITGVFAAYAIGVIVSLFLLGHVSDWVGRRRMLTGATALALVAGLVFTAGDSLAALLVGRVLSGLAVGVVTTTATAYLAELYAFDRPGSSRRRAQIVGAAANLGGLGVGPLLAGLLAQFAPDPLRTPYLVSDGLLLVALLVLTRTPETVPRRAGVRYRVQHIAVPRAARGTFFAAASGAAVVFTVFAVFSALVPAVLAGTLHQPSPGVAGLVTSTVFLAAAGAQVARRRNPRPSSAAAVVTAGLALITVATWTATLPVFVLGAVVLGGGAGVLFRTLLATAVAVAPAERRGEVLAAFFLAAYVGLAVPVVVLGALSGLLSTPVLMTLFAASAAAALTVAAASVRQPHVRGGRAP